MKLDYCKCKNYLESKNDSKTNDLLKELKRRVNITYRTRINATNRLREKHNQYKKLNIYYSALITAVSIITIGIDKKILNVCLSNIVLMFSIVLTYFMFYISEQNLQERAYKMEETFKKLDKLKNKISIFLTYKEDFDEDDCKKLYKEYESIIESIENHEEIDYHIYKLHKFKKQEDQVIDPLLYMESKKIVCRHNIYTKFILILKYVLPTLIIIGTVTIAIVS